MTLFWGYGRCFRAYTAFLLILGSQSTGSCIHLPYHYKPSRTWVDLILYYLMSPVSGHGRFPKHSGRNIRLFAGSSSCPWQRLVQPTWSGVPPSEGGTWALSFWLWFDSPPTLLDMSRNSIWVFGLHPSAQGNVLIAYCALHTGITTGIDAEGLHDEWVECHCVTIPSFSTYGWETHRTGRNKSQKRDMVATML